MVEDTIAALSRWLRYQRRAQFESAYKNVPSTSAADNTLDL
jgi:hypothetical protein